MLLTGSIQRTPRLFTLFFLDHFHRRHTHLGKLMVWLKLDGLMEEDKRLICIAFMDQIGDAEVVIGIRM